MCDFDACLACGTCGNLPVNSKYPQKTMSTNVILGNMLLTAQNVAGVLPMQMLPQTALQLLLLVVVIVVVVV